MDSAERAVEQQPRGRGGAAAASRRPWPVAAGLALAFVYAPTLTPFVAGPLTSCEHCVSTYLRLLPIVPGFLPGAAIAGRGGDVGFYVASGAVTALLLVAMLLTARRLAGRDAFAAGAVLALLIGVQSHFLGIALRA